MDLNALDVVEVLKEKGVTHLYHSNTVTTARTFLNSGQLLSRDYVQRSGLAQTSQYTDGKDRRYEVFNHLFMDTVDIHERISNRNFYGPVLFRFHMNVLSQPFIGAVRVTKRNPLDWEDKDLESDRYYQTIEELRNGMQMGSFGKMVMFKGNNGSVPLNDHLETILLDNPKGHWEETQQDVYMTALNYLNLGTVASGVKMAIAERECIYGCKCRDSYVGVSKREIRKLYFPDFIG